MPLRPCNLHKIRIHSAVVVRGIHVVIASTFGCTTFNFLFVTHTIAVGIVQAVAITILVRQFWTFA